MQKVRSTKRQRDQLRQCHPGVGFIVYHWGDGTTVETEFFIDRKTGKPCYTKNGEPVKFDIKEE